MKILFFELLSVQRLLYRKRIYQPARLKKIISWTVFNSKSSETVAFMFGSLTENPISTGDMVENKQKYNLTNKNLSLKKGKGHITKLVIDNLNRNICTKKPPQSRREKLSTEDLRFGKKWKSPVFGLSNDILCCSMLVDDILNFPNLTLTCFAVEHYCTFIVIIYETCIKNTGLKKHHLKLVQE